MGNSGAGEVYALHVDPDRWSRGVGRTLMLDAHQRLAEQLHGITVEEVCFRRTLA